MNTIRPEDFLRFCEETYDLQFMDAATGKPALELLQKQMPSRPPGKSDYDLWLEEQDEATKLEHRMAEL